MVHVGNVKTNFGSNMALPKSDHNSKSSIPVRNVSIPTAASVGTSSYQTNKRSTT